MSNALIVRVYQLEGMAYAEVAEHVEDPDRALAVCKRYNDDAEKGFVYYVAPSDAVVLMLPVQRRPGALPGLGQQRIRVVYKADHAKAKWRVVRRCKDHDEAIGWIADRTALHRDFILDELRHGRNIEPPGGGKYTVEG